MQARVTHWLTQALIPWLALLFLLSVPPQLARAQDGPVFSQQELDQMLAPIALYPDALLSQILMAATYPLEVVEAERWSVANPGLRGVQAAQAVERNNWDDSVKSLVAFPQILRMMSNKLDWTERLGDAFLAQEAQVMDTVQDLRHRADVAGNLRSNALMRVDAQGEYISIYQADPQIAYEPYYNASMVYGAWWWPQYPPVYWSPWAGYSARPGFGSGFLWGAGITLGAEFFFGNFDWRQHRTNVLNVHNRYVTPDTRLPNRAPRTWQHAPEHRRGTPYRSPAVGARFAPGAAPAPARNDLRGHLPTVPGQSPPPARVAPPHADVAPVVRPNRGGQAAVAPGAAPAAPQAGPGNGTDRANRRPTPGASPAIPAPTNSAQGRGRPSNQAAQGPSPVAPRAPAVPVAAPQRPHALENIGQAAAARSASERGRASQPAAATARTAPPARPVPRAQPAAPAAQRAAPQARPERAPAPSAAPQAREKRGRPGEEK